MHLKLLLLTVLLILVHESLGCNRRRTGTSSCTPVDCRWGDWTKWSTCRGTKQYRFRTAATPASCGGAKCSGSRYKSQTCNPNCLSVDCAWGDWGAWTTCTNGKQSRSRTKLTTQSCGGMTCFGLPDETQSCSHNMCIIKRTKRSTPVDCVWDEWGTWSNCDTKKQSKCRTKTTRESCGGTCNGSDTEPRACNYDDSKCTVIKGNCRNVSIGCEDGIFMGGQCGGPAERKCCVPNDSKCTALNGTCRILFEDPCTGGNFVPKKCEGAANRRCCVQNAPNTTLTHAEAKAQLAANYITIVSSGNCDDRYTVKCTSLEQIKARNIPELIRLKKESGCPSIVVTGGTEYYNHTHGTFSHYNGYKIDIRLNTCITNYTLVTYPRGDDWGSNPTYDDRNRSITYHKEWNHWDIYYKDI